MLQVSPPEYTGSRSTWKLEVELTNYFLKLQGVMWTNLMFFLLRWQS